MIIIYSIIILCLFVSIILTIIKITHHKKGKYPPPPSGCSTDITSKGACPTIKPSGTPGWPPNPTDKLPNCSDSHGTYPCYNEVKTTDTCDKDNLYLKCGPIKDADHKNCCPTGSRCVMKTEYYGQCRPICDQSISNTCCTSSNGCNSCEDIPIGGIGKANIFNKGTLWNKTKFSDKACCYKGGDGKFYYDNGASCNQLVCGQSNGQWMDSNTCNFNKNIQKLNFSLDSYFIPKGTYYELNKTLELDKSVDSNFVSQLIDSNSNQYVLVSAKPQNWFCLNFKDWESDKDCSNNACITNCNKYKDYLKSNKVDNVDELYDCNELCKPINLKDPKLKVSASTTDFGFGSATSCMCNGSEIMKELSGEKTGTPFESKGTSNGEGKGYWVGVATPSWIQSPFNTNKPSGTAEGSSTIASRFGQEYTSNCSSGNGGCGTCWKLTREDNPSQSINAVVIDTCEDTNAYGNNYNWCVAQRPDVKDWVPNPSSAYSGNWPPFFKQLPLASTAGSVTQSNESNGKIEWKADECFDSDGNFICKNMDFHPVHFDVATQQVPAKFVQKMGIWPESTNPKVKAERIQCPNDLKEKVITKHCGKNAGSHATPDEYCPGHDGTTFWSPSNPDGWWPVR